MVTPNDGLGPDAMKKEFIFTDVMEFSVITAPATPGASKGKLYAVLAGGKVSLRIKWPSGAESTIATEP